MTRVWRTNPPGCAPIQFVNSASDFGSIAGMTINPPQSRSLCPATSAHLAGGAVTAPFRFRRPSSTLARAATTGTREALPYTSEIADPTDSTSYSAGVVIDLSARCLARGDTFLKLPQASYRDPVLVEQPLARDLPRRNEAPMRCFQLGLMLNLHCPTSRSICLASHQLVERNCRRDEAKRTLHEG